MNTLRIVNCNCRSVKNSLLDVSKLCELHDIILQLEYWLPKQELGYLDKINDKFISLGSSLIKSNTSKLSIWMPSFFN